MLTRDLLLAGYVEKRARLVGQNPELALADEEWKRELRCDRFSNEGAKYEIDDAAHLLAGSYQCVGQREGFSVACRMFGEILCEMLKGGAVHE